MLIVQVVPQYTVEADVFVYCSISIVCPCAHIMRVCGRTGNEAPVASAPDRLICECRAFQRYGNHQLNCLRSSLPLTSPYSLQIFYIRLSYLPVSVMLWVSRQCTGSNLQLSRSRRGISKKQTQWNDPRSSSLGSRAYIFDNPEFTFILQIFCVLSPRQKTASTTPFCGKKKKSRYSPDKTLTLEHKPCQNATQTVCYGICPE